MKTAVLIPCLNEEQTIAKVVADFKRELPSAQVYVYDNNSSDRTAAVAAAAGAIVGKEPRRGKGNQVRTMFLEVDADIYLLVDGDDTYPAEAAPEMLLAIGKGEADMVIGDRLSGGAYRRQNKRLFHNLGNHLVKALINKLFRSGLHDVMSGMRSFSRRFVQNCVIHSDGFEIETELTLQALDKRFSIREIPIVYRDRPLGSHSKLNTLADGARIIRTIFWIFKDYKPLAFFSALSILLFLGGLWAGYPVIKEFIITRYIAHVPLAILAVGLVLLSALALTCGLILDVTVKQYKDLCQLLLQQSEKSRSRGGD